MPAMIFISVDLPAPFSPMSAWTWPRFRRNDTSSSASTPGKALRTPTTSSRYSAPGTAPLCRMISAVDGLMVAMALRPENWRRPWFRGLRRSYHKIAGGGRRPHASGGAFPTRRASLKRGASRSVLLHELVHVGRGHQLEGNVDLLVDRLAGGERERRVDRALALAGGVLEHGDLEVARLHRGERVLRRIDAADDRRLGVHAGRLHRLERADRHFIVVGDDRVELEALRQPVGHQVLRLRAIIVRRLFGDDLYAAAVRGRDDLMDVLGALHRRLVRQHTLHDEDIALAAEELADLLGLEGARLGLVRGDEGGLRTELVDVDRLAVDVDERHAGVGGGLGDGCGRRGVDWVDDDRVDAVGDEVLNLAQLLGDVVLGVLD